MIKTNGYAAPNAGAALEPFSFQRRDLGPRDVLIDIQYCGVCHSDIHQVRDEWGGSIYPMVPGHEIVGRVSRVPQLPRRGGAVLREPPRLDLQRHGEGREDADLRRLLDEDRHRRGLRAAHPRRAAAPERGAAPLRRDYDLLAAAPLQGE